MKFIVERAKLLEAVSKLQSVVGSKTAMPVLEGILISAEQGKITLAKKYFDEVCLLPSDLTQINRINEYERKIEDLSKSEDK